MMITNSINANNKQENHSYFIYFLYINGLKFSKLPKIAKNSIHFLDYTTDSAIKAKL